MIRNTTQPSASSPLLLLSQSLQQQQQQQQQQVEAVDCLHLIRTANKDQQNDDDKKMNNSKGKSTQYPRMSTTLLETTTTTTTSSPNRHLHHKGTSDGNSDWRNKVTNETSTTTNTSKSLHNHDCNRNHHNKTKIESLSSQQLLLQLQSSEQQQGPISLQVLPELMHVQSSSSSSSLSSSSSVSRNNNNHNNIMVYTLPLKSPKSYLTKEMINDIVQKASMAIKKYDMEHIGAGRGGDIDIAVGDRDIKRYEIAVVVHDEREIIAVEEGQSLNDNEIGQNENKCVDIAYANHNDDTKVKMMLPSSARNKQLLHDVIEVGDDKINAAMSSSSVSSSSGYFSGRSQKSSTPSSVKMDNNNINDDLMTMKQKSSSTKHEDDNAPIVVLSRATIEAIFDKASLILKEYNKKYATNNSKSCMKENQIDMMTNDNNKNIQQPMDSFIVVSTSSSCSISSYESNHSYLMEQQCHYNNDEKCYNDDDIEDDDETIEAIEQQQKSSTMVEEQEHECSVEKTKAATAEVFTTISVSTTTAAADDDTMKVHQQQQQKTINDILKMALNALKKYDELYGVDGKERIRIESQHHHRQQQYYDSNMELKSLSSSDNDNNTFLSNMKKTLVLDDVNKNSKSDNTVTLSSHHRYDCHWKQDLDDNQNMKKNLECIEAILYYHDPAFTTLSSNSIEQHHDNIHEIPIISDLEDKIDNSLEKIMDSAKTKKEQEEDMDNNEVIKDSDSVTSEVLMAKRKVALTILKDFIGEKNRNEGIVKQFFYEYDICRQKLDTLRHDMNKLSNVLHHRMKHITKRNKGDDDNQSYVDGKIVSWNVLYDIHSYQVKQLHHDMMHIDSHESSNDYPSFFTLSLSTSINNNKSPFDTTSYLTKTSTTLSHSPIQILQSKIQNQLNDIRVGKMELQQYFAESTEMRLVIHETMTESIDDIQSLLIQAQNEFYHVQLIAEKINQYIHQSTTNTGINDTDINTNNNNIYKHHFHDDPILGSIYHQLVRIRSELIDKEVQLRQCWNDFIVWNDIRHVGQSIIEMKINTSYELIEQIENNVSLLMNDITTSYTQYLIRTP